MVFVTALLLVFGLALLASIALHRRQHKSYEQPEVVRREPVNRITRYLDEPDPLWHDDSQAQE